MKHFITLLAAALAAMIVALTACSERRSSRPHSMAGIDSMADRYFQEIYSSPASACEGLTRLRDSVVTDSDTYYALTAHIALAALVNRDAAASDSLMEMARRYADSHPEANATIERYTYINGVIHSLYGRNREAADDFLLTADYARANRNWHLAIKNHANAGELLEMTGNPAEGVVQLRTAILLADSTGIHDLDFSIRTRAASIYTILGNNVESDRFYQLNAEELDSVSATDRFYFYSSRGNSYYYRKDFTDALADFIKASAELKSIGDPYLDAVTHSNMGECYMYLDSLQEARKYIDMSVGEFDAMAFRDVNQEFYLNSLRGELELRSGNLDLARRLLLSADADSITLSPRYVALHHHRLSEYYDATGDYREAMRQLARAETLDDSVLRFIARNYTAEVNARYSQDTTILRTRVRVTEKEEEISRLYLWVAFLVSVAVIIILSIGIHSQIRRRRNMRQLEQLRSNLQGLRIENARNRISPHFVFNILNAELPADNVNVRNLVSLMRLNLELCNRQLITLGEELDFIRMYIDVMSPSIGPDFTYDEYIDPIINPEQTKVPGMLLQIVVENAVKHGLMGYDYSGKKLRLDIRRVEGGTLLTIDNTIPAGDYSPASGTGTGLNIIHQAISVFNQRNRRHVTMTDEIITMADGTRMYRVTFFVPAGYDFHLSSGEK